MQSSAILNLNKANFGEQTSKGWVLVDFFSSRCGPCRMLSPVLDEFAKQAENRLTVAKVDVEENPSLAAEFRVQSIPLLVFMKDGQEVTRLVGLRTVSELEQILENLEK